MNPVEHPTDTKNNGTIHVIDDEKDITAAISFALRREGYKVHSFTRVSELLNDIEQKCKTDVSLLITDIRMPELSGFEVARKFRAMNPGVPIIFITAFEIGISEFNKVFPSLQVNDILQKPFHLKDLLEVVKKHI